jgi:two-component sensor histidine kinase
MLASYVRLKAAELERADSFDRESVKLFSRDIDGQINSLARLHRQLTGAADGAEVDLCELLHDVCGPFADGLDRDIMLIEDFGDGCTLRADQGLSVAQIVGEAIVNAIKHAYPDGRRGVVLVRCQRRPSGLSIGVVDYGVGLPATFDLACDGGFGFRLMRGLSDRLGATLRFASGPEGVRMCLGLTT